MFKDNYYIFLLVIILMSGIGLFATDIYLPALPQMATYFNCSHSEIQTSFTVFLLGLAGCQLVAGMLSDWVGRKRILLLGLTLFIIASFLCTLAESLSQFIIFRLFQAMGGGVGSVISRIIISTRYDRQKAVKIFSTVFPIVGMSAAVAPLVGGYLTYFFRWQVTFYFMSCFGIITFLLVLFFLENDRKINKESQKIVSSDNDIQSSRLRGYLSIIRNLEFLGYAFIIGAGFSVFRSYTVESPFVFDNQGFVVEEIGRFYISLSIAYIMGNLSAKLLVNKMSLDKVLRIGLSFFAFGGLCMIVSAITFIDTPYAIILPMGIITMGNGLLFPVSSAGAMTSVSATVSGLASGLMGALQFIMAAFCIHWVGIICQGQAIHMSLFIGTIILFGIGSYIVLLVYRSKAAISLS